MNMHPRNVAGNPRYPPAGISNTQTYSWIIRNVMFDALCRDPFFASYTKKKTKMLAVQNFQLPYLGVYIVGDTMTPDGISNEGEPRLSHSLVIGYSVMIQNNDPDLAEQTIDMALKRIQALMNDPHINNVWDTFDPHLQFGTPDNTRFESINRATRRHNFGSGGLNNETPFAELQYEETIVYKENFPPIITDDLLHINVVTDRPGLEVNYFFSNGALAASEASDAAVFAGTVA